MKEFINFLWFSVVSSYHHFCCKRKIKKMKYVPLFVIKRVDKEIYATLSKEEAEWIYKNCRFAVTLDEENAKLRFSDDEILWLAKTVVNPKRNWF